MKLDIVIGIFAVCSLCATATARADELHPALNETHRIVFGGYFQDSDSQVSSGRKGSNPSTLDLGDLGVDKDYTSWLISYRWRFAERWTLSAAAQNYEGNGSTVLQETIDFDGEVFDEGEKLNSSISVDTYIVDILYSLYRSDRAEIKLGGGLHAFDFDVSFDVTVSPDDPTSTPSAAAEDFVAPLPNLRLDAFYALNSSWAVYGTLGWLSANIDEWSGDYRYLNLRTEYRFSEHFGAGLGYQYTEVDITRETSRRESAFKIEYNGPTLFLTYSF